MPTASYVENLFDPRRSARSIPASEGQTLDEFVTSSGFSNDQGPMVVFQNGQPRPMRTWDSPVERDDVLQIIRFPQGDQAQAGQIAIMVAAVVASVYTAGAAAPLFAPVFGTAASYAIGLTQAAIMSVGAFGASMLSPGPQDPVGNISPTYDQNIQRNLPRLGAPRAVQYGRVRFFPEFATTPYTDYHNNDQILYQILELGLGEFDVHRVQVGGVDSDELEDSTFTVFAPGEQVTGFWDNVDQKEVGVELEYLNPLTIPLNDPGTETAKAKFDLYFPALYTRDSEGKTHPFSVGFDIEYREIDDNGDPVGSFVKIFTGDVQECIDRYISKCVDAKVQDCIDDCLNLPICQTPTDQDCRECTDACTRESFYNECASQDYTLECENLSRSLVITREQLSPVRVTIELPVPYLARWEMRIKRETAPQDTQAVSQAFLARTKAYFDTTLDYSDSTRLAVKVNLSIDASRDAAAQIAVTATAKHRTVLLDPPGPGPVEANSSIASALLDIATASYGAQMSDDEVDIDALITLQEGSWKDRGDEFNYRFDTRSSVWEALSTAARAGRARPMPVAGILSFVRDQPQDTPSQVFSARNIVEGSFSLSYSIPPTDQPDVVEAVFINRDTWKEDRVLCELFGEAPADQLPLTINMPGVTDRDHAWRDGMYAAAAIYYRRRAITFSTEYEGQLALPDTVVPVNYRTMGWGSSGDVDRYELVSNLLAGVDGEHYSGWTSAGLSIQGSVFDAPNGQAKADRLLIVQGQPEAYVSATQSIPSGSTYTFSCYVRLTPSSPAATLAVSLNGSYVASFVSYDVSLDQVAAGSSVIRAWFEKVDTPDNVGGGWYRLWMTLAMPVGLFGLRVYPGVRSVPSVPSVIAGQDYEVGLFGVQYNQGGLSTYVGSRPGYTQPGYAYTCSELLDWSGDSHEILLRQPNGTQDGPFTAEIGAEASGVLCTVPPAIVPYTDGSQERTHLLHGVQDVAGVEVNRTMLCRVAAVSAVDEAHYTLSLVNEVADVHTADDGTPPVPVTIPPLPGDQPAPEVQGLSVVVTYDGGVPVLTIGWTQAPGAEYYILQGSSNGIDWSDITTTAGVEHTWTPGWIGVTHVRVAAVALARGPWAVWTGNTDVPTEGVGEVLDLQVVGGFLGTSITVAWSPASAAKEYIVRIFEGFPGWDQDCATIPPENILSLFPVTISDTTFIYTYEQIVADGGPYASLIVAVQGSNALGAGPTACTFVDLVNLAPPQDLRLFEPWEGKAVRIIWDQVAGATFYQAQFLEFGTENVIRQFDDLTDTRAEYTQDQMLFDLGGVAVRQLDVRVRAGNEVGLSTAYAEIAGGVGNPQMGPPTGERLSSSYSATSIHTDFPTDPDYAGTRVWVTPDAGDPNDPPLEDGYLVHDDVSTSTTIAALQDGTNLVQGQKYRYAIGHYDTWGTDNMSVVRPLETMQTLPGGGDSDLVAPDVPVWANPAFETGVQKTKLTVLTWIRVIWLPSIDDIAMSHYALRWWSMEDPDVVTSATIQHDNLNDPGPDTYSFAVAGLSPGQNIAFQVAAVDWAGNQSEWRGHPVLTGLPFVIQTPTDGVATVPPQDLTAVGGLDKVYVTWTNPEEDNWQQTRIYRNIGSCAFTPPGQGELVYQGMADAMVDPSTKYSVEYCYRAIGVTTSNVLSLPSAASGLARPKRITQIEADEYFESAAIHSAHIQELDGDKIRANTITADQILSKSITAQEIQVDDLSSLSANVGTLTSGQIVGVDISTVPNENYPTQHVRFNSVTGIQAVNDLGEITANISPNGSGWFGTGEGTISWSSGGDLIASGSIVAGDLIGNRLITPALEGSDYWRVEIGPVQDGNDVYIMRWYDGTAENTRFSLKDDGTVSVIGNITVTGGNAATQDDLVGLEAGASNGANLLVDPNFERALAGDEAAYWNNLTGTVTDIGQGFGEGTSSAGLRIRGGEVRTVTSVAVYPTNLNDEWHVRCRYRTNDSNESGHVASIGIQMLDINENLVSGSAWRSLHLTDTANVWTEAFTTPDNSLVVDHPDAAYIQMFMDIRFPPMLSVDNVDFSTVYLSSSQYGASQGADWQSLSGVPPYLEDGRIESGLDENGVVKSWVFPEGSIEQPDNPNASGLFLGYKNMGYWNGSGWGVLISRTGAMQLNGSGTHALLWDGATLTVNGRIIVQSGSNSIGIGHFEDAGALAELDSANWNTQVGNRPTELTDGRTGLAVDSNGNIISRVIPGVVLTDNPPGGGGLYMGSDFMGFYKNGKWSTYMDNQGGLYLKGADEGNGHILLWNGTDLIIRGAIQLQSGSNVAWSAVVDDNNNKPDDNATVGATWGVDIGGSNLPEDNATQGATWGVNVGGNNLPADNATVGATWDGNLGNQPDTLSDINNTEGTKLGGIENGADVTDNHTGGTGANLIPTEYQTFAGVAPPELRFTSGVTELIQTLHNEPVLGGHVLYIGGADHVLLGPESDLWNIPIEPGTKYIFSVYGKMNLATFCNFYFTGNDGRTEGDSFEVQVTLNFGSGAYSRQWGILDATVSPFVNVKRCYLRISPNTSVTRAWFTGFMLEPMVGNLTTPSPFVSSAADARVEASLVPNPPSNLEGLYLNPTHMGFHRSGNWQTYMDIQGKFYLTGWTGEEYLQWDPTAPSGSVLRIRGRFESSGSGQRIDINPNNDNELHFYDNSNTELLSLGINASNDPNSSDNVIMRAGSLSSPHTALYAEGNGHDVIHARASGLTRCFHARQASGQEAVPAVDSWSGGGTAVKAEGESGGIGVHAKWSDPFTNKSGGHVRFETPPHVMNQAEFNNTDQVLGMVICDHEGRLWLCSNLGWKKIALE